MKKYGILLILVIMIISITGCSKTYLKEISYNEYKQLLEDKETFVLEVMQKDCSACKRFNPKLKQVAEEYQIEIKYIDTSKLTENQKDSLGVSRTPTLVFYINGEEETTSARLEGNQSKKKIIEKLKASSFID